MKKVNEKVKKVKITELDKCKKEYIKKINVLNEELNETEWEGILDIDNIELAIADRFGAEGNIILPYTKKLTGEQAEELQAFLYNISLENKLMLFCVDEVGLEEIVLECSSIKKKIEQYFNRKLYKEYFENRDEESVMLKDSGLMDKEDFISIDKETLESNLNIINNQTYDTYYFVKNDILYECNLKERIQLILCGLECVKSFEMMEDSLAINLKDDNVIYLEKDYAAM